jgi:hypothetical protein
MKTILTFLKYSVIAIVLGLISPALFAQSPGGVSSGLAFWGAADNSGNTIGAAMTKWKDLSPNGSTNDLNTVVGSFTLQPGNAAHNFNPWTTGYSSSNYFYGSNNSQVAIDYTTNGGIYAFSPLTIFATARPTSAAMGCITGIDNDVSYAAEPGMGVDASRFPYFYRYGNNINTSATGAAMQSTLNKSSVFLYQPPYNASNTGTGTLTFGLDGNQSAIAGQNAASSLTGQHLGIGYSGFQLGAFTGDVQEVVWYKSTLSAADISRVQSYMAIKYGVTLTPGAASNYVSSSSTVVWTGTAAYQNNVAGIGRDDASALNQKQSNSVNTGNHVLIGNGSTLANTNALNTNSFGADQSFELWGDNGLSANFTTPVSGIAGINSIMPRTWKVQETGTVGTVTVAWPSADASVKLIVSNDAVFDISDNVIATTATTINGVAYRMATVDLTNGQYFTFGSFVTSPGGVSNALAFWGTADNSGNAVGAAMTRWKDLSLNGSTNDLDVVVGSFTLQPGNAAHNFNPWTTGYSSSNYFYGSDNTQVAQDYAISAYVYAPLTVLATARPATAVMGCITGIDNDISYAAEPGMGVDAGRFPYFYRYGNNINTSATGAVMQSTLNKSSVYLYQPPYNASNTGTGTLTFGLDGNQSAIAGQNAASSFAGKHLGIGYSGYQLGAFSGDVQEVIWYKSTLSATEISKIQSYMAIKYGVTLTKGIATNYVNSSNTTVWTGTAAYQNNVAGIGRDDLTALNQKQSNSVDANTNSQVVIGLASVATTNQLNTNTFTKDLTHLMWGDNNNTQSLTAANTVFTYNGYSNNRRMNRIWRVENNGTNPLLQAVKIQFPAASVGTTTLTGEGGCAKYVLIASADPTFATGVTSTVLVVNGANYEVSKKFLTGVSYFTFAKVNETAPGSVYLPLSASTAPTTDACLKAVGFKYYYYDAAKTQRAFAINWNGNTEPGSVNGILTYSASPYSATSGGYQCNIMGRLMEVLPAGGSYTTGGGVKVKIFFDSAELTSSLVPSPLSQKWFKYPGNAAAVIAANNGQQIPGATFLTPSATGEEDGYDYVQFDGISSFSTFGFASNTGAFVLPVKVAYFNAYADANCRTNLEWKSGTEQYLGKFIIEYSKDGISYSSIGEKAGVGDDSKYNFSYAAAAGNGFYRLKIVNEDGGYSYSQVVLVRTKCDGSKAVAILYPNPTTSNATLSNLGAGTKQIIVFDASGKQAGQYMTSNTQQDISLNGLAKGTYIIKIVKDSDVQVFKLIKD